MASTNKKAKVHVDINKNAVNEVRRSVMSCLLWEDNFYENGESVANRVRENMKYVTKDDANKILLEAKFDNKLRHMPLYLLLCMAENKILDKEMVDKVVTRVDDMTELVSLYFSEFRKPNDNDTEARRAGAKLPKQLVKGLQKAFKKFDEYQFAKYQALKKEVKLSDVLSLVRPTPKDKEQAKLWGRILSKKLATPDTWEVELSKSKDKKESWNRLLTSKTDKGYNKLGALALLRNLSGMQKAGVDESIIKEALKSANANNILPFQIFNASLNAPELSDALEEMFFKSLSQYKELDGDTIVLVDTSGSMLDFISDKSNMRRLHIASTLAAICKKICKSTDIYAFSDTISYIPKYNKGFGLVNWIIEHFGGFGTAVIASTQEAINKYKSSHSGKMPKRVIVITDEQTNSDLSVSHFADGSITARLEDLPEGSYGYIINIDSYSKGIETENRKGWTTISGWSENVIKYITEVENFEEI